MQINEKIYVYIMTGKTRLKYRCSYLIVKLGLSKNHANLKKTKKKRCNEI